VDYPDYAELVGRAVADGEADAGILICGTGIGMAMAANKIPGVRAAPVTDLESARLAREHNNANVLALGARVTPPDRALDIVRVFVETPFAGGRHERRIRKITALEQQAANELADEMPGR
jgi:ribose 5-phosphate isomerase B